MTVDECTWTATHDDMPGAGKALRVSGECMCDVPDVQLRLERQDDDSSDDQIVLRLTATPSSGDATHERTPCIAPYHEDNAPEYQTVRITGQVEATVKVIHPTP
ncbi:MAG: hypothetical protein M3Q03_08565 [Chloroflexota bacterium]|nr:hypothetical protein [Chloroflexota bacterium]